MKKIILGSIILFSILAAITNPKKNDHYDSISQKIIEETMKNDANKNEFTNTLVNGFGDALIKERLSQVTEYNNYILFSTLKSKAENQTVSIGLFGNFILNIEDPTTENEKKESKATVESEKWKKMYKIVTPSTGYIKNTYGWEPSIIFYLKRLSKKEPKDYVNVRAEFYDERNNKISGTEYKIMPYYTKGQELLFKSKKRFDSYKNLKNNVKIFIDNEFVENFKITNIDLFKDPKKEKSIAIGVSVFKGKINNKYPITIEIKIDNNKINGNYYYDNVGTPINLSGEINGESIEMIVKNEYGDITEKFKGNYMNGRMYGDWYNLQNSKKLNFETDITN